MPPSPESASAPCADQLRAGVGRRVVRGGADQAAVELARADQEVADLGRGLAGVEHVDALGDQPGAVARGELGRAEAHVVRERDPQLARRLAGKLAEHAREGAADLLGDVAVDLLAVEAADVVGLEDRGVELHAPHPKGRCARDRSLRVHAFAAHDACLRGAAGALGFRTAAPGS